MLNQLDGFSLLGRDWQQPFKGTVIRIPLRSSLQAGRSEICSKETTIIDIKDSLDSFANEMGSNGLLFLKSVRRIVLSVNDEQLSEVEITNADDLNG
jgi:hypothetical protein